MNILEIISSDRLDTYLLATGHDQQRALAMYGWNIQISEAFFPVLSAAEVSLRNTICARFQLIYGPRWWSQATFLKLFSSAGRRIIKTARDKREKKGLVTSGGMTAELNFGFWVNMLLPRHQQHFWRDLHVSFGSLPANIDCAALFDRCDSVRSFRNRIFHHEPIFARNISKEYSEILELIGWLSPDKAEWIKSYSRVMAVLRTKP